MNAKEMHDFEQAMMDDPMLADAVDGYQLPAGKLVIADDLAELKERLEERNKKTAGIIIGSFRQWMSIAASLVVLLSTAVVLYRIFYHTDENKSSPAIAEVTAKKDSAIQLPTKVDSQTVAVNEKEVPAVLPSTSKPVLKNEPNKENKPAIQKDNTSVANEQRAMNDQSLAGATTTPAPSMNEMKQKENVTIAKAEVKKESADIQFNKFIGKVVDENNQPMAFANIKEKKSGIGTYADANGNFTLISADSILNVETKYAGYFVTSAQLKSNQLQKIVLKDEAVIANAPTQEKLYEKNKSRPSAMKTEVNESDYTEPFDGWQKYNIYVANNLRNDLFKDKIQTTETKQVEISFDVNPDGSIANFKVERSNCNSCNSEAIRLLKEGPKWKSKTGKKERSSYTVHF
jgi:outer membrane biosynthesis protein TonB